MTLILQAVELFGEINENEKLQYVRLFGGLEKIRKSFENRKPLSLELNHNSNITATYSDNNNYALKLKRRRKLIDGKWHYQFKAEIIGSIPLTARFRCKFIRSAEITTNEIQLWLISLQTYLNQHF